MNSIESRLAKLETSNQRAPIVVWCNDPADVETKVSAMIAEGQISEADRDRLLFIHWATAAWEPGSHERALAEL
jgi:hypothetical protein